MAWTAPRTWVAGEVVTAALGNTHWKDNLRYLKGLDGAVTIGADVTVDNLITAGNVDGVDVSAHKAGTARAQHTGGAGSHTHRTSGAEGAQLDHGLALTGVTGSQHHTKYTDANARSAAVSDTVYGAGWNGVTTIAASKNAVYDELELLGGGSKIITATRVNDAVSGDVAYTGVGFKPHTLIALASINSLSENLSIGFADENLAERDLYGKLSPDADETVEFKSENNLITLFRTELAANYQRAVLKTLDADGFTLTWTKGGTGCAVDGELSFLCIR